MESLLGTIALIASYVIGWFKFKKMGRQGWEALVPFYNLYVEFEVVYGNGMKFLLLFIPIYNIYVIIKLLMDTAVGFNKPASFGWGMFFLPIVFEAILAFDDNVVWRDGSAANNDKDVLNRVFDKLDSNGSNDKNMDDVGQKIKALNDLYNEGLITEEEFTAKREELIKKL